LQVRDDFVGGKASCPGCGQVVNIPPPAAPAGGEGYVMTELVEPTPQIQSSPPAPQSTGQGQSPPPEQLQEPLTNHNREPLPQDLDFFAAPPAEIGPLLTGYSTLRRDMEPVAPAVRLVWILGSIIIGLLLMAVFVVLRIVPMVFVAAGIMALGIALAWLLTRFSHRCTYVGREGVVQYFCNGDRDNLRGNMFLFQQAAELRTAQTRHYVNGGYTGTSYSFTWTDFNGGKVFKLGGQYQSAQGTPKAKDPFWFATSAELAWSLFLLKGAPRQLEGGGSIRFGLKGADSLRVGDGFILLTRRGETIQFRGDDIARLRIQQGVVAFLEPGAREGWFSSTGVYKFPYSELANAQFFLILLEHLFGIRANA
jgi:hypothetical protein